MKSNNLIKKIFILSLAPLLISGCDKKEESSTKEPEQGEIDDKTQDEDKDTIDVDVAIYDSMKTLEDKSCYNVKVKYSDKYFESSPTTFNKKLMMLSFGSAMSANKKDVSTKFFSDLGFSTIFTSPEYETGGTEDSVHFVIAKKVINGTSIYAVAIKGTNYKIEWANNFKLGESGNHEGFYASASKVYEKLLNLLKSQHNYKIWVCGYSRGGAISNVLSSILLTSKELSVSENNLFAYTFATPQGLTKENAVSYKNVFNMVNSADIVPKFAPSEFGLFRCGTDIDIYNEQIDSYLSSFSSELKFPTFIKDDELYKSDPEFTSYVMSQLLKVDTETYNPEQYPYDLCSREHFHSIEAYASYLIGLVLNTENLADKLLEKIKGFNFFEIYSLFLDNGTSIYTLFSNVLDEIEVDYDVDTIKKCAEIVALLGRRYLSIVQQIATNTNAQRMIYMHMAETTYILLNLIQ